MKDIYITLHVYKLYSSLPAVAISCTIPTTAVAT